MRDRIRAIAQELEPHAKDFRTHLRLLRFVRGQMQRPYTRSLAGLVEQGLSGPVRWTVVGLRRLSQMGEARRA